MKKLVISLFMLLGMVTITLAAGDPSAGKTQTVGDPSAGKTKSASCAACHGIKGDSVIPNFPKLAGQNARYLEKQLGAPRPMAGVCDRSLARVQSSAESSNSQ